MGYIHIYRTDLHYLHKTIEVKKSIRLKNYIFKTHSEPKGFEFLNCDEFRRSHNFCRWVLILGRDIQTESNETPAESKLNTYS
jgi:hypothetical protein